MSDDAAARELKLYIDNDGDLYRRQTTSILKNLATKRARGQYRHDLAVKAFGYLVEAGAKKYAKEFGSSDQPWHKMFDTGTRKLAAEELARDFEAEASLGNYDHLLPKKYRPTYLRGSRAIGAQAFTSASKSGGSNGSSHALKKISWKTPESIKVVWSPANLAYFALWPGRGAIKDQQVLKIARAEEMHDWLRETYGDEYGHVARASSGRHHATIHHAVTAKDIREFRGFLRNATDRQVQGIYDKEKRAGRDEYVELAIAEAARRGIELDLDGYDHARRKSPAQLDRDISRALSSYRGRW
jgi:hypothetical protein